MQKIAPAEYFISHQLFEKSLMGGRPDMEGKLAFHE